MALQFFHHIMFVFHLVIIQLLVIILQFLYQMHHQILVLILSILMLLLLLLSELQGFVLSSYEMVYLMGLIKCLLVFHLVRMAYLLLVIFLK